MKRLIALCIVTVMMVSLVACGGQPKGAEEGNKKEGEGGKPYKAALLINGTLGDKSFFDSASDGLVRLQEELGEDKFDFKVEQMGGGSAAESQWEPTLYDYCDQGDYDVIIMGTWQMAGRLANAAKDYPDQKFIFFDQKFDFEVNPDSSNIYNVLFKQNEVSYLVGAAAAMMTTSKEIPNVDPDNKVIGFLGGMDNVVINDFLLGYIQGAVDMEPEIQIPIGFVGDFINSAAGKDIALSQFQNGVDVSFSVAGNAGLGQVEAAAETGKYSFGVDSDQAALLPNYASSIPSSALKNVGNSLGRAIKLDMENKLTYGAAESLGFAEGGVELVKGKEYETIIPEAIRTKLDELEKDIISGKITVQTSQGMETSEIEAIKDKVSGK